MSAQTMLGRPLAQAVKDDLTERVARLAAQGVVPTLGTVLVGEDPGSRSYVAGKHRDCAEVGIGSLAVELPAGVGTAELAEQLAALNEDPACTGYLVQLPLPEHLDEPAALELVDPDKDVDGLHPTNLGRLALGSPGPLPCTPRGIVELLRAHGVPLDGAGVCVVGRGTTVGRPLALLLSGRGPNATVTLCHTGTRDLAAHTRSADLVVAAAGVPDLIDADMVAPGAVLVAVGITRTPAGLVGDFHPSVLEKAAAIAPVPGGVGPLTRAMLLSNLVERAEALARDAG